MNYVAFICSEGEPAPEAMAVMQRELPVWIDEMDGRGVRLLGRELDLPEAAVTVRVRDGETLVSDGPFAETRSSWRDSTCSHVPTWTRRSRWRRRARWPAFTRSRFVRSWTSCGWVGG